jgi:hypothetical protein
VSDLQPPKVQLILFLQKPLTELCETICVIILQVLKEMNCYVGEIDFVWKWGGGLFISSSKTTVDIYSLVTLFEFYVCEFFN